MTHLAPGLEYRTFRVQDTWCHLLAIDLELRELRPVMDQQTFPFRDTHPQQLAVTQGAVALGTDGFNLTLFHGLGISDQPQHTLVVDDEIWTTGLGAGGYGVLIGDGWVKAQKNHIQVHVWRPDGTSVEVEHVNRGHEGEVVAFTPRGGENEFPKYRGKWFYSFRADGVITMVRDTPPKVWPDQTVLESTYDLGLSIGDVVKWKQNLGAEGVHHIISGWPQIVRDGVNIVPEYELDPTASHGPDAWFTQRNPRSAIGHSEDGKTAYMLCVEGRLPNSYRPDAERSRGLRLKALAEVAVKHDVYGMVNMDGGGSAFLWLKDGPETWGCYNTSGTMAGQRPGHFATAVF